MKRGDPLPYSNIIPRRRDEKGDPKPRRHAYTLPLITLDQEALRLTVDEFVETPELIGRRLVWLKAMNAVAASENSIRVQQCLEEVRESSNTSVRQDIDVLEREKAGIAVRIEAMGPKLATILAVLNVSEGVDTGKLDFGVEEPVSLEVLAGRYDLPSPEAHPSWATRSGYRILAAAGGGAVFGFTLGLLTGKLELVSFADEWPSMLLWSVIGMIVLTLIGAVFTPTAKWIGGELFRLRWRTPWLKSVQLLSAVIFLAGLTLTIIRIESKVEQLGLLKSLTEQTSLRGATLSSQELAFVSLMLVVPTVFAYITVGLSEGERVANVALLRSLQDRERQSVRSKAEFATAAGLAQQLHELQQSTHQIDGKLENLHHALRTEATVEELLRMEDMEMDAAAASWEAERALTSYQARHRSELTVSLRDFIARLFGRPRGAT